MKNTKQQIVSQDKRTQFETAVLAVSHIKRMVQRPSRAKSPVSTRGGRELGFLESATEVAPGVWAATAPFGWHVVAKELASILPGTLWPGKRSVSWVCGRPKHGGAEGRIFDLNDYHKICQYRDLLADLGLSREVWSIGGVARELLEWVADPATCKTNSDHLFASIPKGYHCCYPGKYENAVMYDAESCYFHLLQRLGTLRVDVSRQGRIYPEKFKGAELSRWNEMLSIVEPHHVLRNSIVGCAMGAGGARPAFTSNGAGGAKQIKLLLPGGPFRGAGQLIMRSAYELTSIAALQVASIYSSIDSVTTTSDVTPDVWTRYGLPVRPKGKGAAHIVRRNNYKVGPLQTVPYSTGLHLEVPVLRLPPPPVLYHRQMLA